MGATPVLTSVSYSPGKLRASWTATPPAGFTGYTVMLVTDGGQPEEFPAQVKSFTLDRTLLTTSTYTLQVAMNVTGQPPDLSQIETLITVPPQLTSVANSGAKVVYRWSEATGAGVEGYVATLSSPATNWNSSTDSATLTATFDQALAEAGDCTAWVRATSADEVVMGPASTVRTVITQAPTLTGISNRGPSVLYTWLTAGGGGVEGYAATLSSPATNWNSYTDSLTLKTTFDQALAGLGTCTGWVRAMSADGVVLGPATPTRTLITEAPVLTGIVNSGAKVVYQWTAAGGEGVEAYFAGLSSPFTDWTESTDADVFTATFDQALAGLGTCTGWVRGASEDGVVRGPPTPVRTVITEAPTMTIIDNGGAEIVYRWQSAGGSGVEGYVATLTSPATNWNSTTDEATLTTSFTQALAGLGTCTGWVRARSADSVVLGPATASLTLITEPSTLASLAYDSGQLGVGWTPAGGSGVTAYVASVSSSGQPTQDYPIGTSGTGTAGVVLAPGGVYQVAVRGTAPHLAGPPGNAMQPLTTRPGGTTLRATTPSGFKVAWGTDPDPRVTGFIAEFLADGTSQGTAPVSSSPATFPGQIANDVVYQGRVRSTAPGLQGPWTDLVNGPYMATRIPAYDALGRLTGVTWQAGASVAYVLDTFGDIRSVTWRDSP